MRGGQKKARRKKMLGKFRELVAGKGGGREKVGWSSVWAFYRSLSENGERGIEEPKGGGAPKKNAYQGRW